LMKHQGFFSL